MSDNAGLARSGFRILNSVKVQPSLHAGSPAVQNSSCQNRPITDQEICHDWDPEHEQEPGWEDSAR